MIGALRASNTAIAVRAAHNQRVDLPGPDRMQRLLGPRRPCAQRLLALRGWRQLAVVT